MIVWARTYIHAHNTRLDLYHLPKSGVRTRVFDLYHPLDPAPWPRRPMLCKSPKYTRSIFEHRPRNDHASPLRSLSEDLTDGKHHVDIDPKTTKIKILKAHFSATKTHGIFEKNCARTRREIERRVDVTWRRITPGCFGESASRVSRRELSGEVGVRKLSRERHNGTNVSIPREWWPALPYERLLIVWRSIPSV